MVNAASTPAIPLAWSPFPSGGRDLASGMLCGVSFEPASDPFSVYIGTGHRWLHRTRQVARMLRRRNLRGCGPPTSLCYGPTCANPELPSLLIKTQIRWRSRMRMTRLRFAATVMAQLLHDSSHTVRARRTAHSGDGVPCIPHGQAGSG